MKTTPHAILVACLVAVSAFSATAQQNTLGTPAFESFARGPIDDVNLSSLNTHMSDLPQIFAHGIIRRFPRYRADSVA